MKNIIIRTLGGKKIGYGHFYRCLSLAKGIKLLEKDIKIIFIINEELVELIEDTTFKFSVSNKLNEDFDIIKNMDIDLFIFDSYLADNEYLKKNKRKAKLMLIDDNNDIYDSAIPDILYNGNIHAKRLGYNENNNQLQLLGSQYLIMKEEYWRKDETSNDTRDGILITTGGSDEYGISYEILKRLIELNVVVRVIIGPGYKDDLVEKLEKYKTMKNVELIYRPSSLKKFINESKIVITAGGSTVYEVLSQGALPIIFSLADNQDLICKELIDRGINYLGKYPNIEYKKLKPRIKDIYNNKSYAINKELNFIDGQGVFRVINNITKFLE